MQKKGKQHISISWLWLFMALYLLNISVDAPDLSLQEKEDLSFNDQESIIELVVEKFLGFDNAIVEQDDADSDEQTPAKKNFSLDHFVMPKFAINTKSSGLFIEKEKSFYIVKNKELLLHSELTQPPEV